MRKRIHPFLAVCAICAPLIADGAPKIQPDKTVFDFGHTTGVESVSGKFIFTNAGASVLKFDKPLVSCGCTLASLNPETVQPDGTAELEFTLELGKTRAKLAKAITIISNDPDTPRLELIVKADYVPLYELLPSLIAFNLRQGDSTNLVARFNRTDGKELKINKIQTSKPWITAKLEPVDSQSARILITVAPDGGPRRVAESLQVFTENPEVPVASAFISGRVFGDVRLSADSLFWNISDAAAAKGARNEAMITRRLLATSTVPGKKFELSNASSSLQEVEVTLNRDARGYQIVAKLAELPDKSVTGTITIDTDVASQPKLEIPVRVVMLTSAAAPAGAANSASK